MEVEVESRRAVGRVPLVELIHRALASREAVATVVASCPFRKESGSVGHYLNRMQLLLT